ncbi:MAG: hypothetical protein ACE5EA_05205 [Nitrospirota bacterium]
MAVKNNSRTIHIGCERRNPSLFNKGRRALNDYWLVPVIVVYLQFYAALYPPTSDPIKNLYERNINFFSGISILYEITTNDFPYTLIGHFKEILIRSTYGLNIAQPSNEDLVSAINNRTTLENLYNRLLESRRYKNTEIGGILTISYNSGKPELHLYEIPSANGRLSKRLHILRNFPEKFLDFIRNRENIDFISMLQINSNLIDKLIWNLSDDMIKKEDKRRLIDSFIKNYDIASQSAYLLMPNEFKNFIGRENIRGNYAGFFHFHNSLNEPPSDVDIKRSFDERQIVFTVEKDGVIVYDIIRGKQKEMHLSI